MTFVQATPPANLTPETAPLPEIDYPDSDGLPMSDNTLQFEWITLIKENLDWLFADNPDVFVAGDLLWYPVEGDPKIRQAPDTLVAFGRPKGYRGSYKQWQEDGIAPQVVFEILSPGNRRGEMSRKLVFYQKYGVEEYYLYDPDENLLEGWFRQGEILDWIEELQDWVSPRLGIRFDPSAQPLVIYRPDGEPFLSFEARSRQAEQDKLRAEREAQRAEQERQRAEQERQRAEQERQQALLADRRAQEADCRAQEEAQRAEQERQRALEADRRAQEETQRAEQERQRADRLAAHLASLGIDPDLIP